MHKLMVADEPWHYRQVTYWDMPKCATCEHYVPCHCTECQGQNGECYCSESRIIDNVVKPSFGCVYHSSIPLTIPTPSDKA